MDKKEVMHNNNCRFYLIKFNKNKINIKFKIPKTKKKIYLRTGNGKKTDEALKVCNFETEKQNRKE